MAVTGTSRRGVAVPVYNAGREPDAGRAMSDIRPHVLIVDDDAELRGMLCEYLSNEQIEVDTAPDGAAALRVIERQRPDLVLLDVSMPGLSGFDVLRRLREKWPVPVLMLTARDDVVDRVLGLELGADDYLTKPFSTRELVARINAVLRRALPGGEAGTIESGGLKIDTLGHRVTANGEVVTLGPTEYRLLKFFMEHPERVYTRGQLLDRIWGGAVYIEERTVDVHVRRLRKALEPSGLDILVQTVRGSGYRFSARPE